MSARINTVRKLEQRLSFGEAVLTWAEIEAYEHCLQLASAFNQVPRHYFIEPALRSRVFEDISLPIGFGQTISKPSTVAKMIAVANVKPGDRVLEIGFGCGYVLAILSLLGVQVFGVEKLPQLARATRRRLDELGIYQAQLRCGDGRKGWKEHNPFDVIIVSAAFDNVPVELFKQLKPGGRLICPLFHKSKNNQFHKTRELPQTLRLFRCTNLPCDGGERFVTEDVGTCQFVIAS